MRIRGTEHYRGLQLGDYLWNVNPHTGSLKKFCESVCRRTRRDVLLEGEIGFSVEVSKRKGVYHVLHF